MSKQSQDCSHARFGRPDGTLNSGLQPRLFWRTQRQRRRQRQGDGVTRTGFHNSLLLDEDEKKHKANEARVVGFSFHWSLSLQCKILCTHKKPCSAIHESSLVNRDCV